MRSHYWALTTLICLLLLAGLACTLPPISNTAPSPTPVLAPTPLGDTLSFAIPNFSTRLASGESVPGARLEFVGQAGDTFNVRIDGLDTIKRPGDSFIWSGVVAPGVYGNYNLRLATGLMNELPAAGQVELIIFNPAAIEAALPSELGEAIHFPPISIDYTIPLNGSIPGTTLTYAGIEEIGLGAQSNELAKIGGLSGYPNLAQNDSLQWTGRMLDNVFVRYNLWVESYTPELLHLTGSAELWITP